MPDEEMIERVANEIMKIHWDDPDGDDGLKIYYRMSRAAIKAMREPTKKMLDAGESVMQDYNDSADCWDAMIEAIIA